MESSFASKVFPAEKKQTLPLQFGSGEVIIRYTLRQYLISEILQEFIVCFIPLFDKCGLGRNSIHLGV